MQVLVIGASGLAGGAVVCVVGSVPFKPLGELLREPIATGVAASSADGAVDSFVLAAATELPRGIRINALSPTVPAEATGYHPFFPRFPQVTAAAVGQSFVKAVKKVQNGRVVVLDA